MLQQLYLIIIASLTMRMEQVVSNALLDALQPPRHKRLNQSRPRYPRCAFWFLFIFNHFNFDDPISFRQFCHCKFSSHEQFETQYNTQQQQGCNLDASYWLKHVIV